MKEFFKKFFRTYVWLGLLIFIIDICSKWAIQLNLDLYERIEIIPGFFNLTKSYNLGAAFGMGNAGTLEARLIWISVSLIMSAVLIFYYVKHYSEIKTLCKISLIMIIAGAIGNLIDRAFYWEPLVGFDGVIDFLDFIIFGDHFATFNVADSSLVIGVCLMILYGIIEEIKIAKQDSKDGKFKYSPNQLKEMHKDDSENN